MPLTDQEARELFEAGRAYWQALSDWRRRRMRARSYYRGDQWCELREDPERPGVLVREDEYLSRQGIVPLKNNIIRALIKNLLGQYRSAAKMPQVYVRRLEGAYASLFDPQSGAVRGMPGEVHDLVEQLSALLSYVLDLNRYSFLTTRIFEEFLIGGLAVARVHVRYWPETGRDEVTIDDVEPYRFWYNTAADKRFQQLDILGVVHDVSLPYALSMFATSGDPAEEKRLLELLMPSVRARLPFSSPRLGAAVRPVDIMHYVNGDAFTDGDLSSYGLVRLHEIWYLEGQWNTYLYDPATNELAGPYLPMEADAVIENMARPRAEAGLPDLERITKYEPVWRYVYLNSRGDIISDGASPYGHLSHPFVIAAYPALDGECWGIVEDVIDQQRYINRAITMIDYAIAAGAKGVLLWPKSMLLPGMTEEELLKRWTDPRGVIIYDDTGLKTPGLKPEQITQTSIPAGVTEILQSQLSLIRDIAGVMPAQVGQPAPSNTPYSLYVQQVLSASVNNLDIFTTFWEWLRLLGMKVLKTALVHYSEPMVFRLTGQGKLQEYIYYQGLSTAEIARNLDLDVSVVEGQATAIFWQAIERFLIELLQAGAITVEEYSMLSQIPTMRKILEVRQLVQGQQQGARSIDSGLSAEDLPTEQLEEGELTPTLEQLRREGYGQQ